MQHMNNPNRPADPSRDAAAQPPQSDQETWDLGRIFADSHEKVLEDCAAAANESDRTERREGLASSVHSLMRQTNLTGTTVTRAPPDAKAIEAAARTSRHGKKWLAAHDRPQPETCDIPDYCPAAGGGVPHHVAYGLPKRGIEAVESGGDAAPSSHAATDDSVAGGAETPTRPQAEADTEDPPLFEDEEPLAEPGPEATCNDGAPDSPGDMQAAQDAPAIGGGAAPSSHAAVDDSVAGGAETPPRPQAEADTEDPLFEDDEPLAEPVPEATCNDGAPDSPGDARTAQDAPAKGGGAAPSSHAAADDSVAGGTGTPPRPQAEADTEDPLFEDDEPLAEPGPKAACNDGAPDSSGDMRAASQAAPAQAAPQSAPAQATSPQTDPQAAPAQADAAASEAATASAGTAPQAAAPPAGKSRRRRRRRRNRRRQRIKTRRAEKDGAAAAGEAARQIPIESVEAIGRDVHPSADTPPRADNTATLAPPRAQQPACAAANAGAVREVFGISAASLAQHNGVGAALPESQRNDDARHGPDRGNARSAAAQPSDAGGAPHDPQWRDSAHHGPDSGNAGDAAARCGDAGGALYESLWEDGPDPDLAGGAGPGGDWCAPADAGPFGDEWDESPNDCVPPDGWELDDGADGIAGSCAAPDDIDHDQPGAARVREARGRRRGGPRFGRWAAASLVAATATFMIWTYGDDIARFSGWHASQPVLDPPGAPDGGVGEIRRMVDDALARAPGETAPSADAGHARELDDGAGDLRGMIADALDEGPAPDGAGSGPAEPVQQGGLDAPEAESAAAAITADPINAAEASEPTDIRIARIERRIGDVERGAVSAGGLIGALSDAIADSAARMEAIERGRAAMESQLADLERRAAEASRSEGRTAGLRTRLDETDGVVLDLAARVATLEAEADAGAVAMIDGEGGADAPGWLNDWGPDPFAADGPRTQWENSVDDNPVYRRIPAAARLVRDQDGRIVPVFVETPAATARPGR